MDDNEFNVDVARAETAQVINAAVPDSDIIKVIRAAIAKGQSSTTIQMSIWPSVERNSAAQKILDFAKKRGFPAQRKCGGDQRDSYDYIEISWK